MIIRKLTRLGSLIVLFTLLFIPTVMAYHPLSAKTVMYISFIAFLVKLGLAVWVYLKNPSAKVNQYFTIVFLGQALWDFGKFMMWQIPHVETAMLWGKISYTGYIISVFFFLQFVWAYLKKKNFFSRTLEGKTIFYLLIFVLLGLLWFSSTIIQEVVERPAFSSPETPFWTYEYGIAYNYFWLWFQILPFFYGLFAFSYRYFKTRLSDKRKQLLYAMIGCSFPIIIGIPTGVILPALGIVLPPHNNILTLIMSIFLTVGIAKYKFLSIEPVGEKAEPKKLGEEFLREHHLEYSNFYLVRDSKSVEVSYDILLHHLAKKNYGLIISSRPPKKIEEEHGVKTTPMVWITESETEHLAVDPVDIEQLYETIRRYCDKVKNAYILLDGLDYLLQHNNFRKMLHFIQDVEEVIEEKNGVLIIPEGNLDISNSEKRIMEKELTLLPHSKGAIQRRSKISELAKRFKTFRHVILGFTAVTESLLAELEKENIKPMIVTTENIHHHIPPERLKVIKGDPLSKRMLLEAGVDKPKTLVMITMKDDSEAILAVNKLRQISESLMVVTNIDNQEFVPIAEKAGANHVVPSSSIGGRLISLTLCAPNAVRWMMDATTLSNKEIELIDVDVNKGDFFYGKTVKEADDELGKAANIIAVKNKRVFQKIPDDNFRLAQGDKLVLITNLELIKKKAPEDIREYISSGKAVSKKTKRKVKKKSDIKGKKKGTKGREKTKKKSRKSKSAKKVRKKTEKRQKGKSKSCKDKK